MFENSEKLLFFLVIALIFLGPEKMAGLGTTLGRAIRDFRSTMRGAQETFTQEVTSVAQELSSPAIETSALLPAPEPTSFTPHDLPPETASARGTSGATEEAGAATPSTVAIDDQSSLASEPTARALAEHRARANGDGGR